MLGNWIATLFALAGQSVLLQAGAIIVGTFILEDAATVIGAMQAEQGALPIGVALGALYIGIVLGDLGLYGLGRLGSRIPWIERWLPRRRREVIRGWVQGRVFKVVLISRFLPGMRLPVYTTCGFVGADFRQFTLAAVIATTCWTTMLFTVSLWVGRFLMDHFGAWRWAGAAGFVVFVIVAGRLAAARVQNARR